MVAVVEGADHKTLPKMKNNSKMEEKLYRDFLSKSESIEVYAEAIVKHDAKQVGDNGLGNMYNSNIIKY